MGTCHATYLLSARAEKINTLLPVLLERRRLDEDTGIAALPKTLPDAELATSDEEEEQEEDENGPGKPAMDPCLIFLCSVFLLLLLMSSEQTKQGAAEDEHEPFLLIRRCLY